MDYHALRHFADTWGLVFMSLVFIGAMIWVFRPGTARDYRKHGDIPFRHDDEDAPR